MFDLHQMKILFSIIRGMNMIYQTVFLRMCRSYEQKLLEESLHVFLISGPESKPRMSIFAFAGCLHYALLF